MSAPLTPEGRDWVARISRRCQPDSHPWPGTPVPPGWLAWSNARRAVAHGLHALLHYGWPLGCTPLLAPCGKGRVVAGRPVYTQTHPQPQQAT